VALVAMGLGVFLIANDFTALSVAIPNIEHDLDTSLSSAQWVINAYALVFGVLIVTGGRFADMFGRKRIFMIGAALFALFSLLTGIAPTIETLIAGRALMGIGGALMWPAILGMVYAILPDDKAGLAGGLILGIAGLGNAAGPILGGILTDELSWRWVFFLNVPVALFAMIVTHKYVDESRADADVHKIDYGGIALVSTAIVTVLLALDEGPEVGFGDPAILALFAVSIVCFLAFLAFERRQGEAALVPKDVLQNRVFAACALTVLFMSAIFFAALLYLPQFLEKILGYDALTAGVALLPMMGTFAVTSFVAGNLYDRFGGRVVVASGALALAAGMFLLALLEEESTYLSLVPGMIVLGMGVGLFYSSVTTTAVTALDPSRSSLAGGIVYMCQIAGGAVGLGLNTAIVASASNLTDGIQLAFAIDGVLALCGLGVILITVPGRGGAKAHRPTRHDPHLRHRHRANA
jgi:EmrB/QacA subfamily drug resistance transporter